MVVKSKGHKIYIKYTIMLSIFTMGGIIGVIYDLVKGTYDAHIGEIRSFFICMAFFGYVILSTWAFEARTMIFDVEGVEVRFWKFSKKFFWDELKTMRLEYYQRSNQDLRRGVVFCTKKILKMHKEHPCEWALTRPSLSLFYVIFPVDPNDRTERSDVEHTVIEPYEVDEEEFMTKMREWNVPIENCLPEEMKANYKW